MVERSTGQRAQRLGLMVLVVALAGVGLLAQPGTRVEPERPDDAGPAAARAVPAATAAAVRPAPARPASARPAADEASPPETDWRGEPVGVEGAAGGGPVAGGEVPTSAPAPLGSPSPDVLPRGVVPRDVWGPDVVVAREPVEAESALPLLRVTHVPGIESAQPMSGPPLTSLEGGTGTGDGILGFEPGMRFWFGPQGLERLPVSTEAQQ